MRPRIYRRRRRSLVSLVDNRYSQTDCDTLRFRKAKNLDMSSRLIVSIHLLALLTYLLASYYSLLSPIYSAVLIRFLACSLIPEVLGKGKIHCPKTRLYWTIVQWIIPVPSRATVGWTLYALVIFNFSKEERTRERMKDRTNKIKSERVKARKKQNSMKKTFFFIVVIWLLFGQRPWRGRCPVEQGAKFNWNYFLVLK